MNSIIEFKNVSFAYDKHNKVLHKVNFKIYENEFVAITGPNGCGKSTLLKLLLNQLKKETGSITIMEQEQHYNYQVMAYVPQNVGLLFQNFPANVYEVVGMNTKKTKQQVIEMIKTVGLEKQIKHRITQLSGGQMQRVAIAKALINQPKILVLDEPTTGIDKESMVLLYELLHQLSKNGTTIVMVTHDLAGCKNYITKALCLEDAHICELTKETIEDELLHKHRHQVEEWNY